MVCHLESRSWVSVGPSGQVGQFRTKFLTSDRIFCSAHWKVTYR